MIGLFGKQFDRIADQRAGGGADGVSWPQTGFAGPRF
jgi:hypothetical protein